MKFKFHRSWIPNVTNGHFHKFSFFSSLYFLKDNLYLQKFNISLIRMSASLPMRSMRCILIMVKAFFCIKWSFFLKIEQKIYIFRVDIAFLGLILVFPDTSRYKLKRGKVLTLYLHFSIFGRCQFSRGIHEMSNMPSAVTKFTFHIQWI